MNVTAHPLLGYYTPKGFGAFGYAVCHKGVLPQVKEQRLTIASLSPKLIDYLVIDNAGPSEHATRRFSFEGLPIHRIEQMLSALYFGRTSRFRMSGPSIGRVEHILGREGENYLGRGSTSQWLEDCEVDVTVAPSGVTIEFQGSLDRQGFLDEVVPELYMPSYAVRCRISWQVACFYFSPNMLDVLFAKFGS